MKLDAVSLPRIMLQIGFCSALVAGTYLISADHPKDSARLLNEVEDGPFTLGTKGDRLAVVAVRPAEEHQAPVQLAMAPEAEAKPVPVPPPAPAKPKRVSVVAPPAQMERRDVEHHEVAPPAPASVPAWTAQPVPPQPAPVAQPVVQPLPPPPPKPKQQETLFGLPPMPTPQEFFDNTVKETNAAFGKMKQAMEDAFR